MNIYEGNSKDWYLLIISLTYVPFGLTRNCNESAHEACKAQIDKYILLDEKQESLNKVTNRWKICRIKDTSQYPDIWFNELFNLNLKFKKIKAKYEEYEDEIKAQVFDFLPEEYKPAKVSFRVKYQILNTRTPGKKFIGSGR